MFVILDQLCKPVAIHFRHFDICNDQIDLIIQIRIIMYL